MAVLNSDHLIDQAERLITPGQAGAARQADLRRAVSAAYYAVFHHVLASAADEFVGVTKRRSKRYALVYRSVDHRALKDLCAEVRKPQLGARYLRYSPASGFGGDLQAFASAVGELQEKRHSADYDPVIQLTRSDARVAIVTARSAILRFGRASPGRRTSFLSLLLFPPR